MSWDEGEREHTGRRRGGNISRTVLATGVLLIGFGQLALAGIAIDTYLNPRIPESPPSFKPYARVGDLEAVTLMNGQTVFGTLVVVDSGTVVLENVFLIRTVSLSKEQTIAQAAATSTPTLKSTSAAEPTLTATEVPATPAKPIVVQTLVRAEQSQLYQPKWMSIPAEKILIMEPVGSNSKVAQLIIRADKS